MYQDADEADSWDEEDSGDEFDFVAGSDGFPNVVEISFAPNLSHLLTPVIEEDEGEDSSARSKSPAPSFSKYLVAEDEDGEMVADSSRPRTAAFRRRSSVAPSILSGAENRENEVKLHLRKREETPESSPRQDTASNRILPKSSSQVFPAFSTREENGTVSRRRPDDDEADVASDSGGSSLTSFKRTLLGSLCCSNSRCKSRTTPTTSS